MPGRASYSRRLSSPEQRHYTAEAAFLAVRRTGRPERGRGPPWHNDGPVVNQLRPKLEEVASGIYKVGLPLPFRPTTVNVYLVDCSGQWVLIDTGANSADSLETLEGALAELGAGAERIAAIIGTHHHVDHFGASAALKERSGALTYLHALEVEWVGRFLTMGQGAVRPEAIAFFEAHGFPLDTGAPQKARPPWVGSDLYRPVARPDRLLRDGDELRFGSRRFQVVWTPGHAPGHSVIYLARERVMFAGDHLLPQITPHVGFFPGGPADPLGDFLASQRKVQSYAVEVVLPGHGPVYYDHRRRAAEIIEHHEQREAKVLAAVEHNARTAYEVATQVFGEEPRPLFHLMAATFETLAHLEHARGRGRAHRTEQAGRVLWRAA